MMLRLLPALGLATAAVAEPMFQDLSGNLPTHVYDGGWEHFVGGGVAVFDCNGDALPELFAAGGSNPASLFVNEGGFVFARQQVPVTTGVTGAYPLDINSDGHMDLFVMRVGSNVVLAGDGSCNFVDATTTWGIPTADNWTTAFSAWWEDDGLPVMAIGNYVDRTDPDGPFEACDSNQILRRAERLTDRSTGIGFTSIDLDPGFCPLSMLASDDARGLPTLRISNDRHYYVRDGYEQMWDIAEQRYLGEADGWSHVSLWGMGIASRDLDGDARDEVMLTSMGDQLLQLAQPDGTYTAAPFEIGTYAQRPHIGDDGRPSTGWHAQFGDINNDGRPDLFIAKGNVDQMPGNAMEDPNNLLMQDAQGRFDEFAHKAQIATTHRSRGAAIADLDNDGRLDLVVVNRRAPIELYRNVTTNSGHWLQIRLAQTDGNRDAIGANITVQTSDKKQIQQMTIGGGHAGGQMLPLHFGLAHAAHATVVVEWPDGTKTTHETEVDQRILIQKP